MCNLQGSQVTVSHRCCSPVGRSIDSAHRQRLTVYRARKYGHIPRLIPYSLRLPRSYKPGGRGSSRPPFSKPWKKIIHAILSVPGTRLFPRTHFTLLGGGKTYVKVGTKASTFIPGPNVAGSRLGIGDEDNDAELRLNHEGKKKRSRPRAQRLGCRGPSHCAYGGQKDQLTSPSAHGIWHPPPFPPCRRRPLGGSRGSFSS